jgi:hypothetical protein
MSQKSAKPPSTSERLVRDILQATGVRGLAHVLLRTARAQPT